MRAGCCVLKALTVDIDLCFERDNSSRVAKFAVQYTYNSFKKWLQLP